MVLIRDLVRAARRRAVARRRELRENAISRSLKTRGCVRPRRSRRTSLRVAEGGPKERVCADPSCPRGSTNIQWSLRILFLRRPVDHRRFVIILWIFGGVESRSLCPRDDHRMARRREEAQISARPAVSGAWPKKKKKTTSHDRAGGVIETCDSDRPVTRILMFLGNSYSLTLLPLLLTDQARPCSFLTTLSSEWVVHSG